jgi:hypothetical protein
MHRSGTSAVSGTLAKLGAAAPKTLLPFGLDNPRGHFESLPLMTFHDQLLASAGTDWRDWRSFDPAWFDSPEAQTFKARAVDLYQQEFQGAPLAVFKDPRICRFLPFWIDVLKEIGVKPHVVMPIRSPLDVAQSLNKAQGLSLTHGVLLWLRHVLDAERHSRGITRSVITWTAFLSDWRSACNKIAADMKLVWPRASERAEDEVDSFLTHELNHHQSDLQAISRHPSVHEWAVDTYKALIDLSDNPLSNPAIMALNGLYERLNQSCRPFDRLIIDYEIDLERGQDHARQATAECDAFHTAQAATAIALRHQQAQTATLEVDLEQLRQTASTPSSALRAARASSEQPAAMFDSTPM